MESALPHILMLHVCLVHMVLQYLECTIKSSMTYDCYELLIYSFQQGAETHYPFAAIHFLMGMYSVES